MRLKVTSDAGDVRIVDFDQAAITIGRDAENDLTLDDDRVSGKHARLTPLVDGRLELRDLGSSNGTFVGDKRLRDPVALSAGDVIKVGRTRIELLSGKAETIVGEGEEPPGPDATRLDPSARETYLTREDAAAGITQRIELSADEIVVGRDEDIGMHINDERASRRHASFRALPKGGIELRDLASANGTYVEGKRVSDRTLLRDGEKIRVGDTTFQAHIPPGAEALARNPYERVRSSRRLTAGAIAAIVALLALAVFGGMALAGGGGETPEEASAATVDDLERATVHIAAMADGRKAWHGSGTIIDKTGIILTNAHVGDSSETGGALIYGPDDGRADVDGYVISLFQGEDQPAKEMYVAQPIASDGYLDVALLQIEETIDGDAVNADTLNLPTVELGDSDALENGDPVTVIGYPGVGGGRARVINFSRGNVSGFEPDTRIETDPRGWLKTDADIFSGNSGGLAADAGGHIIGIPSLTQYQRDDGGDISDSQGKIRPINLLKTFITSVRAGEQWTSPYFVAGSGAEKFSPAGATAEPLVEGAGCPAPNEFTSVPSGSRTLVAIMSAEGMTRGLDYSYSWLYIPAQGEPDVLDIGAGQWELGQNETYCLEVPPEALNEQGVLPDGAYGLLMRAGPNLEVVGETTVTVGGAAAPTEGEAAPTEQPAPATGAFPDANEQAILATLPQDLAATCVRESAEDRYTGADAGVYCESGDVSAFYDLFPTQPPMMGQYSVIIKENVLPQGGALNDGACQNGAAVGEGTWERGRVTCFKDEQGYAVIVAVDETNRILTYAVGGTDPGAHWQWWRGTVGVQ